jgi:hypothetical protein
LATKTKERAEIWKEYFDKLLCIEELKEIIKIENRRINNQLDADKLRFIDVISSACFGHHYTHHQE